MRLYFIRHGQSQNNALWDNTGDSKGRSEDPELTPKGHEQARLLGEFIAAKDRAAREEMAAIQATLEGGREVQKNGEAQQGGKEFKRDFFGFTHLYTSLMVRSVATASYVSRALNLCLTGWTEIHECGGIYLEDETGDFRGLPGKSRSYFSENYRDLVLPETLTENGWWNKPFEAYESRPIRAQQVLETLLERHGKTDDQVAIVSHGGFYMELMRVIFKIKEENSWFVMNNTAISRIDFRENGEAALIYHNRTDHLPERLIT